MRQQEYSQHLVGCLKGYFDCPTFSDVTVRSKLKDFYAHRLVLGSQSRYLANALDKLEELPSPCSDKDTGPRMISGISVLDLVEESSLVVEGILYFLYNANYKDGFPTRTPEMVVFNLLMSAAADKYEIPAMKECALDKLNVAAREFWNTHCFLKVIQHAYSTETPAHESDRAVLTLVAAEHATDLMENADFFKLLRSSNQFREDFNDAIEEKERKAQNWPTCMYCNRRHDPSECAHIWSG